MTRIHDEYSHSESWDRLESAHPGWLESTIRQSCLQTWKAAKRDRLGRPVPNCTFIEIFRRNAIAVVLTELGYGKGPFKRPSQTVSKFEAFERIVRWIRNNMNLKMRIEEQYPNMANEMYELILREEANFHAIPDGSHRQPCLFSGVRGTSLQPLVAICAGFP